MTFSTYDGNTIKVYSSTSSPPDITEGEQAALQWDALKRKHTRQDQIHETLSEYYRLTKDHPFLDMSSGAKARRNDADLMRHYLETEQAPSPYQVFPPDLIQQTYAIPHVSDLGINELRNDPTYRFAYILGAAFGEMRHQHPFTDPTTQYWQQELIGKAVPSGGSRHPSELFIQVHQSPSFPRGFYHFNVKANTLDKFCTDQVEQEQMGTSSASPHLWRATLHICSAVQRAMYRYRDPRSFRAILIDIGHIDAQLATFAAYCNWQYSSSINVKLNFGTTLGVAEQSLPRLITAELRGG